MKGVALTDLAIPLHTVAEEFNEKPVLTIPNLDQKRMVKEVYGGDVNAFVKNCHRIWEEYFDEFSFEEICKCNYSTIFMASGVMDNCFKEVPQYRVVEKIRNSMWRTAIHGTNWNETVLAYESLRKFTFSDLGPDFDVRLDYTTGCNEKGYSEHSRVFLDGVFAFLLYYKGEHAMTIGFSFYDEAHILLQQVQLAKAKGNRWLYRFPENRLEYILSQFRANFPDHHIMLIKGEVTVDRVISDYSRGIAEAAHWINKYSEFAARARGDDSPTKYLEDVARHLDHKQKLEERVAKVEADRQRLVAFYENVGNHTLRRPSKRLADSYQLVT